MNKYIAKNITLAQISSDAGKHIFNLELKDTKSMYIARQRAYDAKEKYIINAIMKINSIGCGKAECHFHVTNKSGNDNFPYLIYFDFKLDGKRYQVSFHSKNKYFERYVRKGTSCRSTWDEKSSRYSCYKLIKYFDL